ncbi:MAG: hypothetical protein L6R36_008736 [Xanthoria steineri]|nr:MAG: hypothetical protein L6R36_008736 [Xanthoria steineri]
MMHLPSSTNGSRETAVAGTGPLRIWHCTHPRTASNVLAKQLRGHPQLASKEYTFMTAFLYGPESDARDDLKAAPHHEKATFQSGFDELQDFLASIEQEGKNIFIKEHISFVLDPRVMATKFPPSDSRPLKACPRVVDRTSADGADSTNGNGNLDKTNPSVLPDSFIRSLSPIIQIRHPAISIPSYYRAFLSLDSKKHDVSGEPFSSASTFAWSRMIFDWFCEHVYPQRKERARGHDSWPLVVDGDDLVNENERVMTAICSLANLDTKGITKEWDPISEEIKQKQPENVRRFLSTLQASNGIIKSGLKGEDIVVEDEAKKWIEEFGAEVGNRLKQAVEATMDDYRYLSQFRI